MDDSKIKSKVLEMMKSFLDDDGKDMFKGDKKPKSMTMEIVTATPVKKVSEESDGLEDLVEASEKGDEANSKKSYASDIESLVPKAAKGVMSPRDFFKK